MTHKIAIEALTRYAPSPLPFNISPVASGEYVLLADVLAALAPEVQDVGRAAIQPAGLRPCALRGTGQCYCPTACQLDIDSARGAPVKIEGDRIRIVENPEVPAQEIQMRHDGNVLHKLAMAPSERTMFEAWATSDDGGWLPEVLKRSAEGSAVVYIGDYVDDDVQAQWAAWQARAQRAAVAEAPTRGGEVEPNDYDSLRELFESIFKSPGSTAFRRKQTITGDVDDQYMDAAIMFGWRAFQAGVRIGSRAAPTASTPPAPAEQTAEQARAELAAMPLEEVIKLVRGASPLMQVVAPSGWKLVPVEATHLMIGAGARAMLNADAATQVDSLALTRITYPAMLAAAPLPPAVAPEQASADPMDKYRLIAKTALSARNAALEDAAKVSDRVMKGTEPGVSIRALISKEK